MPDDRLGARRAPAQTSGRVPYVWVSDDDTGHRYDIPEPAVREGMTPVEGVEPNYTQHPRPTKYFVGKAGDPTTPAESSGARAASAVKKEAK